MSTDIYSTQLQPDGSNITPATIQNQARFVQAQITDQILQTLLPSLVDVNGGAPVVNDPEFGGQNGANPSDAYAIAINVGGAYLRPGSGNNKVQVAPGMLLQKIANSDGTESKLLPYTFAGTEEFTLTNGSGANPRVDLLQMKLEYIEDTPASTDFEDAVSRALTTNPTANSRRRVQCTLSVKAGTVAASPQIPDPDAGFCAVGSVLVGTNYNATTTPPIMGRDATGAVAVVHDQRMPLSVKRYPTDPTQMKPITAWALGASNRVITASSATNELQAPCFGPTGRLVGVEYNSSLATAGTRTLCRYQNGFTTSLVSMPANTIVNDEGSRIVPMALFEANQSPSAGPTILPSATKKIGVPVWTSGYRMPVERFRYQSAGIQNGEPGGATLGSARVAMRFVNNSNTDQVGEVVFFVAEGL